MFRSVMFGAAAWLCCGMWSDLASAQDSVLQELYGRGVHAFFGRDYFEAHKLLTTTIDQGSRDPRAYYFRALTLSKLGRPDEAQADFQTGAMFELNAAEQFYDISNSLQRIQGADRMALETVRRDARVAARQRAETIKRTRYDEFQDAEKKVMRKPGVARPAPSATSPAKPAAGGAADDLFGDKTATPPPAADPSTPEKPAVPAEDPFGDDAPKKPAPMKPEVPAEDPFGDEAPAKPAAEKPMAEKPAADPFADEADAPAKPAAKKPADDPFGDDPAEMPAEKKPAAEPAADEPAAEKPAADKPAADDPFADDAPDKAMEKEDAPADAPAAKKPEPKKTDDDPFAE